MKLNKENKNFLKYSYFSCKKNFINKEELIKTSIKLEKTESEIKFKSKVLFCLECTNKLYNLKIK